VQYCEGFYSVGKYTDASRQRVWPSWCASNGGTGMPRRSSRQSDCSWQANRSWLQCNHDAEVMMDPRLSATVKFAFALWGAVEHFEG
jgi:hypothetical protein